MSEASVRRWLARYEQLGMVGASRKTRRDRGQAKTLTWRTLDERMREAGRSDQAIAELAERIRRHVPGLLTTTSASASMIAHASIGFVAAEMRAAGVIVSQDELIPVCRPSAAFVRAERQARLVDVRRNDAGRYAAQIEPRIRRDRSHLLPLDVVAGDVAHLDILVRRPDGSTATAKIVAFMDLATNRVVYKVYLLAKGEGIRREHVLHSFIAMCAAFGVPSRLLLDHGSEFAALDLFQLKVAVELSEAEPGVQRSRPYIPSRRLSRRSSRSSTAGSCACCPGTSAATACGKRRRTRGGNLGPGPAPSPTSKTRWRRRSSFTTTPRSPSAPTSPAKARTSACASISPPAGNRCAWSIPSSSARFSAIATCGASTAAGASISMGGAGATTI